jgi:hypothetical protein
VVQRRQDRHQVDAVVAFGDFDRHRALPGGRQADVRLQHRADALRQAEALEAGGGQDDGRVVAAIELAQAGIEVAAQRLDDQVRVARRDQRLAAQAAGADDGAGRQRVERGVIVGDEGVARVFALQHGGQANPSGNSIGTSLSECTARSARPSAIATSSSLTNRPLPPTLDRVRSRI